MNFYINKRKIGVGCSTYIIAELSANHEQDFDLAVSTLRAVKDAGADAIKLQTYTPESMTLNSEQPWFKTRQDSLWAGQKLYALYQKAYTPWEWHPKLQKEAATLGLDFFSSPFDIASVDRLESINVPVYKIASFEITDIPLIRKVAQTGKPIIFSTGIASLSDIELAIETCHEENNGKIALLKCTSAYPTPLEDVNLNLIPALAETFGKVVGISDHTPGASVPAASVALGAAIIEKHFILDKDGSGLDKSFSLDPAEFKQMVDTVREVEKALGNATFEPTERMKTAKKSARSLFIVENLKKGDILTPGNVRSLRPADGLHPKHYDEVLGMTLARDAERGTPLDWSLLVGRSTT